MSDSRNAFSNLNFIKPRNFLGAWEDSILIGDVAEKSSSSLVKIVSRLRKCSSPVFLRMMILKHRRSSAGRLLGRFEAESQSCKLIFPIRCGECILWDISVAHSYLMQPGGVVTALSLLKSVTSMYYFSFVELFFFGYNPKRRIVSAFRRTNDTVLKHFRYLIIDSMLYSQGRYMILYTSTIEFPP